MTDYNMKPFRFWCQKVLPLVYDDSLSYMELLCKVVNYLNHVIEDINGIPDYINQLISEDKLKEIMSELLDELREQVARANEGTNTTASYNRSKDELVWLNGKLIRMTRDILAGDRYVLDDDTPNVTGNYIFTSVEIELTRIKTSLSQEATTRENADTLLQNNIDAEANTRSEADTQLQNNINTEASTRQTIDTNIINRIEDILKWRLNFSRCIFLGDSYMETAYLQPTDGFVYKFCQYLNITNYNMYGKSGSGFINDGGSGGYGTYFDILENDIVPNETNPNEVTMILVEGGANDGAPTYENYSTLVSSWITEARTYFPNAKIVIMETPTFDVILNNTRLGLKTACEQSQALFIDSGLWLTGNTNYEASSPNLDHPTAEGCSLIAQNLFNTMLGSNCKGYFRTTLPKVSDTDVIINASYFIVDGDTLTIIVNGGINNKDTRYVPILNWPEHFYNHIGRFEGVAYTGLGTPFPIWLTETSIQLDTLSATAKSTDFQFTITTSVTGLFGIT